MSSQNSITLLQFMTITSATSRNILWGCILTFIHQQLLVTDLYLNLDVVIVMLGAVTWLMKSCSDGWSFEVPFNLSISGATGAQRERTLRKQYSYNSHLYCLLID